MNRPGKTVVFLFLLLLVSVKGSPPAAIDKGEARKAFLYLNDIRTNPGKYKEALPFLDPAKIKQTRLAWNDTLAAAAERKALDMANRDYFGHVDPNGYAMNYFINKAGYKLHPDWLKDKKDNFFESLAAGPDDGEGAIRQLLIDKGVPSLGHRKHLLGMEEWNASLVDIGIGYATRESGGKYKTYVSVLIARHDW